MSIELVTKWRKPTRTDGGTPLTEDEKLKDRMRSLCADELESALQQQGEGSWIAADDVNRLVRELDVALNGEEGAAKQASLCDVVAQVKQFVRAQGRPVFTVFANAGNSEANFIADSELLNCPSCGGSGHVDDIQQQGEAVVEINGIDEYGPMLSWYTHWVDFPIGTKFYTQQPKPVVLDELTNVARRNLRQYISKASFSSSAYQQAAINCIDVIEAALGVKS